MDSTERLWFQEPNIPDNAYAGRGEHTLDWLARSTLPRAREYRRFLNYNLNRLPAPSQETVFAALRERWHSAFFELIVARILQELGGAITIEDTNTRGKRPDFSAQYDDGRIVVEAVAPIINAATGNEAAKRVPLLIIVEAHVPPGWRVGVWELPDLGPTESKKQFENAVEQMLAIEPPSDAISEMELVQHLPSGVIHLHLWANQTNSTDRQLALEPPLTAWDNTEQRIRYVVKDKRRQVREADMPVILAVHASGISSEFEDFDTALFGRTYGRLNFKGEVLESGFRADGVFMNKSDKPPTYAGALAFLEVGPAHITEPILYLHPRFKGSLPRAILGLRQRWYDADMSGIQERAPEAMNFLSGLHLIRFD